MTIRGFSTVRRLGGVIALLFLAAPAVPLHAATFNSGVSYLCAPTGACGNTSMVGIEADPVNNVIYAVDGNAETLIRIDGTTDTYVDSFDFSNCGDPRRPTVAHSGGITKIYVGCEDQHSVQVLKVSGGRLGTISEVKQISLAVTYPDSGDTFTTTYEPKTERANDAAGLVYVVGDNAFNESSHLTCNDPAFAIDTHSDTLRYVNATLGTPVGTGCNGESGSFTGINDVAFTSKGNKVFWFNEDDHRVYRTNLDLTNQQASNPVTNPCSEDAPQHGAVGQRFMVLAVAEESVSPCGSNPENGGLFSLLGSGASRPFIARYQTTLGFGAGPVITIARDTTFVVTDRSNPSGLPNCELSCIQIRDIRGTLEQTIPINNSQNDVTYNAETGKLYLSLDEREGQPNIAVVTLGSGI